MERYAIALKINDGKMNDYRRTLGRLWPEITAFLDRNKIRNFSIWNAEDLIFIYGEHDTEFMLSPEEEAVIENLTSQMSDLFTWVSTPGQNMRLMYHNFGIVRSDKELIRHRMFMTRIQSKT